MSIQWPGYSTIDYRRRVPLVNGKITTGALLAEVARAVLGFITMVEVISPLPRFVVTSELKSAESPYLGRT